jgi:hypothetical protein
MSVKLNREAILAARKLSTKEVSVPEWGDADSKVTIRELTAGEAQVLGAQAKENENDAMLLWVIAGVIDEDGSRMFSDGDKDSLSKLGAGPILRVGTAVVKLCGFAPDEAKATEKN